MVRLIILFLFPVTAFGQTDSEKEVYSIVRIVIKEEKFDKKLGLELEPAPNCSMSYDTSYLPTLLIKPEKEPESGYDSIRQIYWSNTTWPDKNIFTQDDIDHVLATKELFENFKWDNSKLGFNLSNKENRYQLSVPYFNKAHDKAIMMYRYLCPGLCGTGKTLLLTKKNNKWEITMLGLWYH